MQGGDYIALVKAGAPNITGSGYDFVENKSDDIEKMTAAVKGAIFLNLSSAVRFSSYYASSNNTFGNNYGELAFDAARASKIYGGSNTIQPPAFTSIIQFKY